MVTDHRIIIGDARDMREVADESVHLIVTSPPYWQLKDYGAGGQIGFDDTYEEYINNLNLVWAECDRVLLPGCRICIDIGDQFARAAFYGRYKIIPIRTEIIKFCETIGFDYMGAIIWQKLTTCNTSGGGNIMGSYPYPRNGVLKLDYEFILVFRKGGDPPPVSKETKEASRLSRDEWNQYFTGHWFFPGEKQHSHLAVFPEELPKRLIKMFSFTGETVLDPFLGSGTTTLAARNLGRNSIGYEISRDSLPVLKERLGLDRPVLFDPTECTVTVRPDAPMDFRERIARLPYIFHDTVTLDKKVDPRTMQFGSRIDRRSIEKKTLFSVKEVISPEIVRLSNGQTIRLLGIKETAETSEEAVQFLKQLTQRERLFFTLDTFEYVGADADDALPCYLYLKNRTFVNAHIIKSGLVDVDTDIEYKYKKKFLRLRPAGDSTSG